MTASNGLRRFTVLLVQLSLLSASYILSFILVFDLDVESISWGVVGKTLPLLIAVRVALLWAFRLYHGLWRYVSIVDLVQIIKFAAVSSLAFALLAGIIFGFGTVPAAVLLLDWAGAIFLLGGIRLSMRVVREEFRPIEDISAVAKRVLIVGAGDAGANLCAQILRSPGFGFTPVAFVDDDPGKVGHRIHGVPVAGVSVDLPRVVNDYRAQSIIIAIPSSTPAQLKRLVQACQQSQVSFKVLPPTLDILDGNISITRIREVDPVDLLGRPPAKLDRAAIRKYISGRRVLVTGAAGSVGSELARQISSLDPGELILIDHSENPLFYLEAETRVSFPGLSLVVKVADVTNEAEMGRLMAERRPQIVFHAAAHKHVPLMERSPAEAVGNNVGGTYITARTASVAGARTFVLVSTDKAVNPSNVMGATKRLAELFIHAMNETSSTRFKVVRFGNVVGSNASVVPIFKDQLSRGGPITVTHPDATRYFMSLSEAAGLILQAGMAGKGGETFLLDMGDPIRIVTIAETLISLSRMDPGDVDIVFTGLRPGEKLAEELTYEGEIPGPTGYDKLHVLNQGSSNNQILADVGALLDNLPSLEPEGVKDWLQRLVPEYKPHRSAADVSNRAPTEHGSA